jgi:hypothetical protein
MKHAGSEALQQLAELLESIRTRAVLKERSTGVFYLRSRAFLHFHEDPAGLFADLREGTEMVRLPVNTAGDRRSLLARVDAACAQAMKPNRI